MEMQGAVSQDRTEVLGTESSSTLWSLVKDFCDYTSAHGLGRIMAATHWTRTVFWTMLLLGATTIMTIQVHTLFQKYQGRPLTTLVTVETSTVRHQFVFSIFPPVINTDSEEFLICAKFKPRGPRRVVFVSSFLCVKSRSISTRASQSKGYLDVKFAGTHSYAWVTLKITCLP